MTIRKKNLILIPLIYLYLLEGEYGNELEFPSQYIDGYGETLEESMDDLYDKLSDLALLCETITHNIEDIRYKIRSKNLEYIEVDGFGEPLH